MSKQDKNGYQPKEELKTKPPKMSKKNKGEFIGIRMTELEVNKLDNFITDWLPVMLSQKHYSKGQFKRSGILRMALEEFIERYDMHEVHDKGNPYDVRVDDRLTSDNALLKVLVNLRDLRDKSSTIGENHLYEACIDLIDSCIKRRNENE